MCLKTTPNQTLNNNNTASTTGAEDGPINVVIAGAGPAGLLAAIHILRRNEKRFNEAAMSQPQQRYKVTLIDANCDYGSLTPAQLRENHRSWMIGLSSHGLSAIRTVPDLYSDYVSDVGVELTSNSIYFGKREMKFDTRDTGEGYVVDRNFVVAALARYMNDKFSNSENLETMYDTKVMYVDGENKRLLVRPSTSKGNKTAGLGGETPLSEKYVSYDILLGCDGIRSSVRNAILAAHRDFECDVGDIFTKFKAVHVDCPKGLDSSSVHVFPNGLPHCNGIALPETGGKLNISFGYTLNDPCDEVLAGKDVTQIASYLKKHFVALDLDKSTLQDFAEQWAEQNWSTTGQVHCNFYHSTKLGICLLGDSAHATSPSIGQGMNTALEDAAVLNHILDMYDDDWSSALPAFSRERVKEGNALTDLAFHAYSLDAMQGILLQLKGALRMILHRRMPNLVMPDPLSMVGKGEKLSVAYDAMTQLGIMQSVRRVNDRIRREYFEEKTGMVTHKRPTEGILFSSSPKWSTVVVAAVSAGAAIMWTSRC